MVIIDDFIRDAALLHALSETDEFDSGAGQWWDAWWPDSSSRSLSEISTLSVRQRIVYEIWGPSSPLADANPLLSQAAGFEHWVGHCRAGEESQNHLRLHRDRDESLFNQTGTVAFPLVGAVFYPIDQDFDGGYLQVFNEDRDDGPFELIQAKFNRLVIFDASLLHGVTEVTRGARTAFAINVWKNPIRWVTQKREGDLADENRYS